MITKLSRFRWLVQVGYARQHVVGTLFDAQRTEQSLITRRATTVEEAEAKRWHARRKYQPV